MTSSTPWVDLPNAKHIDRILADVKTRPDVWAASRAAVWDAAWHAARGAARDAAWNAARDAARGAARDAAWNAAWDAARALIAWDDVAYILDLTSDACRMLIETDTTHHKHAAVLLLPACIAFKGEPQ